jgi:hypothetical protein
MWLELILQPPGVERVDIGVSDDGVPVGWGQLPCECSGPLEEPGLNPDDTLSEADFPDGGAYQVTSPAPERTFATRASMKRRSDRRLR